VPFVFMFGFYFLILVFLLYFRNGLFRYGYIFIRSGRALVIAGTLFPSLFCLCFGLLFRHSVIRLRPWVRCSAILANLQAR